MISEKNLPRKNIMRDLKLKRNFRPWKMRGKIWKCKNTLKFGRSYFPYCLLAAICIETLSANIFASFFTVITCPLSFETRRLPLLLLFKMIKTESVSRVSFIAFVSFDILNELLLHGMAMFCNTNCKTCLKT